MIGRLRTAWRAAPVLTTAFAIALAATVWFGSRAVLGAIYWADPRHQEQALEGWMSVGYIGRSWTVPPDVLAVALGYPPRSEGKRPPPPLERIARDRGVPLADIIAEVEAAIAAHRAEEGVRNP